MARPITAPEGFTWYAFVAVNLHNRLIFSHDGHHWVNYDGTNA